MNQPQISIIIPIYNVEAYLRVCLDSILSQSFGEFECLMIDDGSTDSSASIAGEYAAADERFRLIRLSENHGQSVARNVGLDAAAGRYIVFVDSDDSIRPDFLRFHLELIESTGADIAMSDCSLHCVSAPAAMIARCLYQRHGVNPSVYGKIYKSRLFEAVRFRPGIIYEDLELMPRLWEKAEKIACKPKRLYDYRHRPGSSINSFTMSRLDVLKVTEEIEARYQSNPELKKAASDRRLSANFNIFLLLSANGMADSAEARNCWGIIKEKRRASLLNSRVRCKNKVGIIASCLLPRSVFARL